MFPPSFWERFVATFVPKPCPARARQTGGAKRGGKIDPFEFLLLLVFGPLRALRPTLGAQAPACAEPVTRQAVHQRCNLRAGADLHAAFAPTLAPTLDGRADQPQAVEWPKQFPAVDLLDRPSFDLTAALQDRFPAGGGDGSPANVKGLRRDEVRAGRLEPLPVLAGKRSDPGPALGAAQRLHPGELPISDQGFLDA